MPRFVVLEHDWGGVHWDFMLEVDGSLRTWAVDEPIAPGVELRARALADHRLAYLDYEGPISGGRGAVIRRESGTYRVVEWGEDRVEVDLAGGQLVGRVVLWTAPGDGRSETSRTWNFRLR